MTDQPIEWREPPPLRGRTPRWPNRLRPLMARPGEWAMVYRARNRASASTIASNLRARRSTLPPGKWEFVSRGVEIFARYVGPE